MIFDLGRVEYNRISAVSSRIRIFGPEYTVWDEPTRNVVYVLRKYEPRDIFRGSG